jgi:hypothetical protein
MSTQEQYAPPEDILSDVLTALCHAVARIADSVERIINSESVTAPH